MASWNWPFDRKDMELYGTEGEFFADTPLEIRSRTSDQGNNDGGKMRKQTLDPPPAPLDDPYAWFAGVVAGEIEPDQGLSSLENNMIVTEILDAAKKSAKEGKTMPLAATP